MPKEISKEAYLALEAIQLMMYLSTLCEVIANSEKYDTKDMFMDCKRKCDFMVNRIKNRLNEANRKAFNTLIASDEDVIQFANIRRIFFDSSKANKDSVEDFIYKLESNGSNNI